MVSLGELGGSQNYASVNVKRRTQQVWLDNRSQGSSVLYHRGPLSCLGYIERSLGAVMTVWALLEDIMSISPWVSNFSIVESLG